ncbi:MAG: hypothetical protein ACXWV6_13200 [Chitinophagaceae bacterium]
MANSILPVKATLSVSRFTWPLIFGDRSMAACSTKEFHIKA